jgi:hypothetical protein
MTEQKKEERFNYSLHIVDPDHVEQKRRMTINASCAANAVAFVRNQWPSTQSVLVLDKRPAR